MIDDADMLSYPLADAVLAYLGVARAPADRTLLDQLIAAYGRRVPWESASRIVKQRRVAALSDRPRWSSEFWESAMRFGTGGTCFESNRAFLSLLRSVGFVGDLTINTMGETLGCHTAMRVYLDGERLLVDAGYPIYAALPLRPDRPTECITPWFTYTAQPLGGDAYHIENHPYPKPYLFTLIDRPVGDAAYCAATTADYGIQGAAIVRGVRAMGVAPLPWGMCIAIHWQSHGAQRSYQFSGCADAGVGLMHRCRQPHRDMVIPMAACLLFPSGFESVAYLTMVASMVFGWCAMGRALCCVWRGFFFIMVCCSSVIRVVRSR